MPDQFVEKAKLVEALLEKQGLGTKPEMSPTARAILDMQRAAIAKNSGWMKRSVAELRDMIGDDADTRG